jgi:DNA-directed RNA polymerase alpha subunit
MPVMGTHQRNLHFNLLVGVKMIKQKQDVDLLDKLAFEIIKTSPHSLARGAYDLAEDILLRREAILDRWELNENIVNDGIDQLYLTVRSERCLKAEGIYTLTQLQGCTKERLLKTPNLGSKSVKEIMEQMASIGLKLKGQA